MARSLRWRLVAAGIVWTSGVAVLAAIGFHVLPSNPSWTRHVHFAAPLLIGLSFLIGGLLIVRRGLRPFALLRERLADVRAGRTARLEGDYPSEVAPLVRDLNALLEEREQRVARAAARAGDLAHGLKTPLAIVTQEVGHAAASGDIELAASLRQQVERMRRLIDSHLSQARASAGAAASAAAPLDEVIAGLVRTMQRLHAGRTLRFDVAVGASIAVRVPREDLEEMLGNLVDNACTWAHATIAIRADVTGASVTIAIDDDGPGLPEALRQSVLRRGVRGDETAPGSGLGLAIVRDLAEVYGGSIALDAAPGRGLRARLVLPRASTVPGGAGTRAHPAEGVS